MGASSILRRISQQTARNLRRYSTGSGSISQQRRPWLMLPPTTTVERRGVFSYNFYNLTDNKLITLDDDDDTDKSSAVVVGSSHGWLAWYNKQRNRDVFLSNPMTGGHVTLPSASTLPISEHQTRKYGGRHLSGAEMRELYGKPYKIIINSPDPETDTNCRAIMCFGLEYRLATCRPGSSSVWTPFGSLYHEKEAGINDKYGAGRVARVYQDFAYSSTRKHLYCVTQFVNLECWDLDDPYSPRLDWKVKEGDLDLDPRNYPFAAGTEQEFRLKTLCRSIRYLVVAEKSNQVFLVRRSVVEHVCHDGSYVFYDNTEKDDDADYSNYRNTYKTVGFDVHKINGENGELVRYMDGTLDGMALFIGSSGDSFAIESPGGLNLKPNAIYFTDPRQLTPALSWNVPYGGHDFGLFDYQNKTFSRPHLKRIMPQPMWFTPSPYPSLEEEAEPSPYPVEEEEEDWDWDWKGKGKKKKEKEKKKKKEEEEEEKKKKEKKEENEKEKTKEDDKKKKETEEEENEKDEEEEEEEEDN